MNGGRNELLKVSKMYNIECAPVNLSLEATRTLAVHRQGLDKRPLGVNKETLLDTIDKIGLLQIDTINVVARSHYLVMLARVGLYDFTELDALFYPDRKLFEQRAHVACLIPAKDYEYFVPVILARRQEPHRKIDRLGSSAQEILDEVLAEINKKGPMASKDFEDQRTEKKGWWDWKPEKFALEILFEQGYLAIDRRVNFQRYYDLVGRVLLAEIDNPIKTLEDWKRWVVLRSLACLGVATIKQIGDYYRQQKTEINSTIQTLVDEDAIVPVCVEGWKEAAYINAGDVTIIEEIKDGLHQSKLTVFLSPFDNLIWDRNRVRDLFGFDYRVELYTPLARKERQYGYYAMPILHNGQLVGRLDPKVDRQNKTLIIHSIFIEENQSVDERLIAGIVNAIREFMAFHKADTLIIERAVPERLKEELLSSI